MPDSLVLKGLLPAPSTGTLARSSGKECQGDAGRDVEGVLWLHVAACKHLRDCERGANITAQLLCPLFKALEGGGGVVWGGVHLRLVAGGAAGQHGVHRRAGAMHWLEVWGGVPGTGLCDRMQLVRLVRLCSGQHLEALAGRGAALGVAGLAQWVCRLAMARTGVLQGTVCALAGGVERGRWWHDGVRGRLRLLGYGGSGQRSDSDKALV